MNVYGFLYNSGINFIDLLGHDALGIPGMPNYMDPADHGYFSDDLPESSADFSLEVISGGFYVGVGGDASIEVDPFERDCCKEDGTFVENGVSGVSVSINGTAGFGLGGKVKILGVGFELLWKGPGVTLSGSGEIISPCGEKGKSGRVCASAGLNANNALSGGAGFVTLSGSIIASGVVSLCFEMNNGKSDWYWRYVGDAHFDYGVQIGPSLLSDSIDFTDGGMGKTKYWGRSTPPVLDDD